MISRLFFLDTVNTDPYLNLACEEYLTRTAGCGTMLLFLWQNEKTVVIGRNQDAWRECRVELLEAEGGRLARRLSGGGAVFHDLGNLNFTFIMRKEDFDIARQLEVILRAVRKAGIPALKTGRNDITVEGYKFSGNAFYSSKGCAFHHGTLMFDVDTALVARYLSVSAEKLSSKGVASVRQRVTNLKAYAPALTLEGLKKNLAGSLSEIYGLAVEAFPYEKLDGEEIGALRKRFSSWEWRFGRRIPFTVEKRQRFWWGEILFEFTVDRGKITQVNIYSDAMEEAFAARLKESLTGCRYESASLMEALARTDFFGMDGALTARMKADIRSLLGNGGQGGPIS